jgi:hypothetical protein
VAQTFQAFHELGRLDTSAQTTIARLACDYDIGECRLTDPNRAVRTLQWKAHREREELVSRW